MRISDTVHDSIVDGPGLRFTVFAQGCPHRCPGCHNPHTHDPDGGREVPVQAIIDDMAGNPLTDGLTLSGGEPFRQAADCARIAAAAHARGLNVWTYTGYRYEALLDEGDPERLALLAETDVLVDGPFILALRSLDTLFCGSTNQRLIDMQQTRAEGRVVLWSRPDPLAHFVPPPS